jgi:hypothetical protein
VKGKIDVTKERGKGESEISEIVSTFVLSKSYVRFESINSSTEAFIPDKR